MTSPPESELKYFSPAEANATLPLVRMIVSDASTLAIDVAQREQRLDFLSDQRENAANDLYAEELEEIRAGLRTDKSRLQGFVDELVALGVRPKSLVDGLVDFPSLMEGREVELCWRLGEAEVLHWHEVNAGFDARQPLPANSTS